MDMRRAPAVPAKLVQELLCRSFGRAGVARRQDRAEAIPTLGIGLDAAAQIVLRLGRVEERVAAERVGVPDVDNGAGHRLAVYVAHLALHEQHLALFAAVVEPCFSL